MDPLIKIPENSPTAAIASGWLPYDLADNFCEECGCPKLDRLFYQNRDCTTCWDVITQHRCTSVPSYYDLAVGETWTCPACDSRWTVREIEEPCPDCCACCGHMVTRRDWEYEKGARVATAPRQDPPPLFTPFRNVLRRSQG